ncbi:MAG: DUF1573 domain-containing protein [Candidatus Paceibacter sp.]|nr:DUF1573 domain-containing protein [Candidatus Paceibacter sp.]
MNNKKLIISILALAVIGGLTSWLILGKKDGGSAEGNQKNKIYVAVEEEGKIAVLDAASNEVIKNIDLSQESAEGKIFFMPHNVQVAPNGKTVWVTGNAMAKKEAQKQSFLFIKQARADEGHGMESTSNEDQLIVIDSYLDEIVKRIPLGTDMHLSHVALTPDSRYAIAASQGKGIVYKVNAMTYEVEKQTMTKTGAEPHGLRISPDGKTAYIAMLKGKSLGILDVGSMSLSDVPLKGAAVQSGVTPDGKYALASVYDAKALAVYDIANKKLSYVDLPGDAKGPVQLYPTPDSKFVYMADQGYYFDQPTGDYVYKINMQDMSIVGKIKAGSAPHGVAVSQDGKKVYITNLLSNDVSVIDTASDAETARISVGKMPNGVSEMSGGVAMANEKAGTISFEDDYFNFGTVSMSKGNVNHTFKMRNTGDKPVKISGIYTSCMCTEATLTAVGGKKFGPFGMKGHGGNNYANVTMMPGEEMMVETTVDPTAHGPQGTGPAKKAIYIETDSSREPMRLMMDINVTP